MSVPRSHLRIGRRSLFAPRSRPRAATGMALTVTLSNGRSMPTLGFGTWRADSDKLGEAVLVALRLGYRHFDCAGLYRNEHIVGAAIATAIAEGVCTREDLFITSKLAMTQMFPDVVAATIKKSVADLGVGYLDLYLTASVGARAREEEEGARRGVGRAAGGTAHRLAR